MAQTVKPDELSSAIAARLKVLSESTATDIEEAVMETSKGTLGIIREKAQAYGWKTYPKNLTYRKGGERAGKLYSGATIYGKNGAYRIAHLLEHGHAKVGGGRTRAFPHWEQGEEYAEKELIANLKRRIER